MIIKYEDLNNLPYDLYRKIENKSNKRHFDNYSGTWYLIR